MSVERWSVRPEADALLTKLWDQGMTAGDIATKLHLDLDWYTTRNGVIGRAHRLKLKRRDSPIAFQSLGRTKSKIEVQAKPKAEVVIVVDNRKQCQTIGCGLYFVPSSALQSVCKQCAAKAKAASVLGDASGLSPSKKAQIKAPGQAKVSRAPEIRTCRWPDGERFNVTFCGARTVPGKSYCLEHCKRAFVRFDAGRTQEDAPQNPAKPGIDT